ncbi:MAG: hypothetical protein IJC37_06005 [Clostridia bacterium]|nr:hypothetical protein [Clostridia bacterium]
MDIMDLASKGIVAITKRFGNKIKKNETAPVIPQEKPQIISGAGYRAGFATAEIMPDLTKGKTYYIAGHGSGHVMEGVITPVYISAVWLDCGGDEGMLWLGADIVGLTRVEVNKIRSMILASPVISGCKCINFSCTHSHSGIDTVGYWGKPNLVSIPSNGKDAEYMDMLMETAVKVSEEAYKSRKSGKLYSGSIVAKDSLVSGRVFADRHEVVSRLRFTPDDGSNDIWILNFGGHPNSLGGSNRMLSGEYPYFMREEIAKANGAKVLFGIGAIGGMDAAMLDDEDRVNCVKLQGKMVADAAMAISNDRELEPVIKFIQQPFYLPDGNYVLTLLAMRGVMSFKAYPCDESDMGIALLTELTYMTIGDQKLLFLPGESFVSTVYGSYNDAETSSTGEGPEVNPLPLAEIAGDDSMITFGVSNDMTGYVVPVNEFVLNPTQPYLNGYRDRFDRNHYHETNSMGLLTQKTIADAFAAVVKSFNS